MEQTVVRETNNHNHRPPETQGCTHCSPVPSHVELLVDRPDKLAQEVVLKAVRFIQENAGQDINVSDVVRAVGISRPRLEVHFRQVLGRTPAGEMRKVRLKRAKRLLKKTDLPIPEVAAKAGFGATGNLVLAMKRETGLTPLRYRKQFCSQ